MKGLKKFLTLLCSFAFFLLLSMNADAAESSGDWLYTIGDNGLTITGYTGTDKDVVIPDTLDGYRVGVIGKHAFKGNVTMRSVTIPEKITNIGAEAFKGCAGLSKIYFNAKNCDVPDIWRHDGNRGVGVFSGAGSAAVSLEVIFGPEVTTITKNLFDTDYENNYDYAHITAITFSNKVKTIENYAFADCRDLESVTLGEDVSSIGDAAFRGCVLLEEVVLNDELSTIGANAFENCAALEVIEWGSELDTIGNYAFRNCTSLEEANIPEPVSTIGIQAFANAAALEELTIPESVTTISANAFKNTAKLSQINFNAKNATVPKLNQHSDTAGIGVFSGAGSGASSLTVTFGTKVTRIPDRLFNTDHENKYAYAYVTDIEFGSGVKEIGIYAFDDCKSIETVTFGENVTKIDEAAFSDCSNITELNFNDKLTTIAKNAFENCTNLESIEWGTGLDTIGNYAFRNCTSLEEANIPKPVTVIGVQAFANDTSLEKLTIPESVTTISANAFQNTAKLSEIYFDAKNATVPKLNQYSDTAGVGVFSGAGSGASSLTVTFGPEVSRIPDRLFNTDHENKYAYAYVTDIEFGSGVKEIGIYAFDDCQEIETVTFGENVTKIDEAAFSDCVGITELNFNDKLATISKSAFENCTNLESIEWGIGLDTIGNYAFRNCTSLEEANIPMPTTVIGVQAFANDTSLEKLTIPESVTTISANAFQNTAKLSEIYFNAKNATVPKLNQYSDTAGVGVFSGAGAGSGSGGLKVVFGSTVYRVPDRLFNTDYENKYDYAYVSEIVFENGVKEVGAYAFDDCKELLEVTFGDDIVKIDEYAFTDCTNIKNVIFKDKLAAINKGAFENCTNLGSIEWGTGLDTIGNYAFRNCTSLKEAHIPEPTTVIGVEAFAYNTNLEAVTIPKSVTTISAEAFRDTTRLTELNYNAVNAKVPSLNQYSDTAGVGVFSGAGSGTMNFTVTFGPEVTVIPVNLFNTDYENKYDYAYITDVIIPGNVTEIGKSAFEDCLNLTSVYCESADLVLGENAYKNCPASVLFTCYYGSTTAAYAEANSLETEYLVPTETVLKSIANTSKGVQIKWKKSIGTANYIIYRKRSKTAEWTKLDEVSNDKTSYVDDEVKAGNTYFYTVRAFAPEDLLSAYNENGLKIEYLKAPTNVTVKNVANGLQVKWTKSTGAVEYQVYRSKGTGNFIKVATVKTASYTDKNATANGTKYRYKIYACDNGSKSAASTVKTAYKLKKPAVSSVKSTAAGKLTVKWGKNTAATGYKIQYSTKSSFKNAKTVTVKGKANISKTISGLKKGTKYYVRVQSYKTVSGVTYSSVWSNAANKKTKK